MRRATANTCLLPVLVVLSAAHIYAQSREVEPEAAATTTPASPAFEPAALFAPPDSETAILGNRLPAAAAYICCNGDGGFTVCGGRAGSGSALLWSCVDEHEEDHLAWFAQQLPEACAGQPRGSSRFEMTPQQFRELECSGYRAEIRCLSRARGPLTPAQIGSRLWRQHRLRRQADSRFGCAPEG